MVRSQILVPALLVVSLAALAPPAPAQEDDLPDGREAPSSEEARAVIGALEAQGEVTELLLAAAVSDHAVAVRDREDAGLRLREADRALDAAARSESVDAAALDLALRRAAQAEAAYEESRRRVEQRVLELRALRSQLAGLREKIASLSAAVRDDSGPLTGVWDVSLMPSNLRGVFVLRQSGTLVTGQYRLSGGWTGSLRGTFVAGEVHLERIDSRKGRDAELKGTYVSGVGRIRGRWTSYELTGGVLPQGEWVAVRRP